MSESFSKKEAAPLDAMTVIEVIRQAILQGGASDGESDQLNQILKRLETKEITPDDAVTKAHAILNSRQNDH
ncbi:MAG: hypothetical protein KGH56_02550 [Patescibacteria group bacterium]|nr:hypothetical protein [Patescibacteria group bacterium]